MVDVKRSCLSSLRKLAVFTTVCRAIDYELAQARRNGAH
jgi:hypothetical protein